CIREADAGVFDEHTMVKGESLGARTAPHASRVCRRRYQQRERPIHMKRRLSVTAIFVLLIAVLCRGQDAKERQAEPLPASIEAEKVYIPQDLDDTFVELKRLLPPADIDKIRNGTEDD